MKLNITEKEVAQIPYYEKQWMDSPEVDTRLFLHSLRYLTYGGLGERDKQLHALRILESYMCDKRNKLNAYHTETSLNLL
ncbi:hypothetical protein DPMN_021523 [Dreissena polymorpha]|uniref:Uncharacterized protein n=1 Tax=Dreissena polymorpha TaxID=45954 RepID=A0A9D4NKX7_DREPO|nr:hypothetical protein DPMN_021523 [Dreissena polymorpha]